MDENKDQGFLESYKKVSKEREKIKQEAKQILKKFAKSLESVKFKEKAGKKEVGGFREEKEPAKADEDMKRRILENAPNSDEDCIIAEKKEWQ